MLNGIESLLSLFLSQINRQEAQLVDKSTTCPHMDSDDAFRLFQLQLLPFACRFSLNFSYHFAGLVVESQLAKGVMKVGNHFVDGPESREVNALCHFLVPAVSLE